MSRRTIATVRRRLVALRAEGLTWAESAQRARVLKADGSPDTGMAFTIAVYNREPVDVAARKRLGLPAICMQCRRPMPRSDFKHTHKHAQRSPELRAHQRWWHHELTVEQRDEIILDLYTKKEGMR